MNRLLHGQLESLIRQVGVVGILDGLQAVTEARGMSLSRLQELSNVQLRIADILLEASRDVTLSVARRAGE